MLIMSSSPIKGEQYSGGMCVVRKAASGLKTCSFYFVLIAIFLDSCTTKGF